jgi:hypothetical protein
MGEHSDYSMPAVFSEILSEAKDPYSLKEWSAMKWEQ